GFAGALDSSQEPAGIECGDSWHCQSDGRIATLRAQRLSAPLLRSTLAAGPWPVGSLLHFCGAAAGWPCYCRLDALRVLPPGRHAWGIYVFANVGVATRDSREQRPGFDCRLLIADCRLKTWYGTSFQRPSARHGWATGNRQSAIANRQSTIPVILPVVL